MRGSETTAQSPHPFAARLAPRRMKIAVFTKNSTNPAYAAARLGADRAAQRLGAQTLHFVPVKGDDPDEQSELIDKALAARVHAFVVAPVHPTRVNAAIARINAAGIPLFAFVNPIPADRRVRSGGGRLRAGTRDRAVPLRAPSGARTVARGVGAGRVGQQHRARAGLPRCRRDAPRDRAGRHLRGGLRARKGARRGRAMAGGKRWLRCLSRGQRRHGPRGGRRVARRGAQGGGCGRERDPGSRRGDQARRHARATWTSARCTWRTGNRVRRAASSRRARPGRVFCCGPRSSIGQLSSVGLSPSSSAPFQPWRRSLV